MKAASLKIIALVSLAITLSACVEVEESSVSTAQPTPAPEIGSGWANFISLRKGPNSLAPISLERAIKICRAMVANDKQFPPVLQAFGYPRDWKNNGGEIETAYWGISENTAGISRLSVFYYQDGRIRNATYFADNGAILGGMQNWMTPEQNCAPGATYSG